MLDLRPPLHSRSKRLLRRRDGAVLRGHRVRGAVAVMVALLAVFIFGIAAFGIDLTRALVVRNEVQNAADAAALAGAGVLFPPVAGQPRALISPKTPACRPHWPRLKRNLACSGCRLPYVAIWPLAICKILTITKRPKKSFRKIWAN